jgi:hypothetical protein
MTSRSYSNPFLVKPSICAHRRQPHQPLCTSTQAACNPANRDLSGAPRPHHTAPPRYSRPLADSAAARAAAHSTMEDETPPGAGGR